MSGQSLICAMRSLGCGDAGGRRRYFEPFGGLKAAVIAARDNRDGEALLEMNGFNGDTMTSDPDYQTPQVKDLEIVFVVWDILYMRNQARPAVRVIMSIRAVVSAVWQCRSVGTLLSAELLCACVEVLKHAGSVVQCSAA